MRQTKRHKHASWSSATAKKAMKAGNWSGLSVLPLTMPAVKTSQAGNPTTTVVTFTQRGSSRQIRVRGDGSSSPPYVIAPYCHPTGTPAIGNSDVCLEWLKVGSEAAVAPVTAANAGTLNNPSTAAAHSLASPQLTFRLRVRSGVGLGAAKRRSAKDHQFS